MCTVITAICLFSHAALTIHPALCECWSSPSPSPSPSPFQSGDGDGDDPDNGDGDGDFGNDGDDHDGDTIFASLHLLEERSVLGSG